MSLRLKTFKKHYIHQFRLSEKVVNTELNHLKELNKNQMTDFEFKQIIEKELKDSLKRLHNHVENYELKESDIAGTPSMIW